jgi:hypothetical protein
MTSQSLPKTYRLPDDVRDAFLEILYRTLIHIRGSADTKLCFALSDHAHNIPHLLKSQKSELLNYYWEIERPCFLHQIGTVENPPMRVFEEQWPIIEREYLKVKEKGAY